LSLVLPAYQAEGQLEAVLVEWVRYLDNLERDYEVLIVNDGSADETPRIADGLAQGLSRVRVLHHAEARGFGAALRTGIAAARLPLVVTATAQPHYRPADLKRMLAIIDEVDVVAGFRTGPRIPGWLGGMDSFYRLGMRILFGMPVEPRASWLGWSGLPRRLLGRWALGVRVRDPECAFRLYRRSIFKRIPVQSDGPFVLTEILAKANFLGCLIAEEPVAWLPPEQPGAVLPPPSFAVFRELRRVFAHADFGPPMIPPGEESFCPLPPVDGSTVVAIKEERPEENPPGDAGP
jgi:glycosyltransferase involved in cell wall biosynthesis